MQQGSWDKVELSIQFHAMWLIAVLILVLALLIFAYADTKKPHDFPPGPKCLPFIGCYLEFKKLMKQHKFMYRTLNIYHEKYGPIIGLRLGRRFLISVSGKDAVQEGLSREEFDGRQRSFMVDHRTMGVRRGVIFTDGEEWKEQRRFALRNLRDLGLGKRSMESMIREEALELVSRLTEMGKKAGSEGVQMEKVYTIPVLSSLWTILSGQRYSQEDEKLKKFTGLVTTLSRLITSAGIETVEEHKKTKSDGEPRDFIDTYLDEMKKRDGEASYFSGLYEKFSFKNVWSSEGQLIAICDDLFGAGTETTSYTLAFGVLFLLHHPDVQAKIHEELDRVIGRDRFPTLDDKPNLPYLNAVIYEIRRCCNIVPMTVPHRCVRDTEFRGYTIPKEASIIFNLWSLYMDRDYWGDPHVFRPERFLVPDESGGWKLKDEPSWLLTFGLGQRRCLGEPLARASLYVFFSVISHGLRFKNPPGCPLPSTEGVQGFVAGTGPFKAVVEPRF
ncbi:hypothetical protein J437_LFUL009048 [Ladona fulva]|uniref:Cytochrome P450 n=1 Tax=Ladona fulva TaxID=123851 RepID=A0A8K0K4A7_LADFU|nr:hypothetical protein J437_LFUL009048 [Ladona fulva]